MSNLDGHMLLTHSGKVLTRSLVVDGIAPEDAYLHVETIRTIDAFCPCGWYLPSVWSMADAEVAWQQHYEDAANHIVKRIAIIEIECTEAVAANEQLAHMIGAAFLRSNGARVGVVRVAWVG